MYVWYVLFTCVIMFLIPAHEGSRATPPWGIIASTPEKSLPAKRTASYEEYTYIYNGSRTKEV